MSALATIASSAAENGLAFLLAGGHAVIAHGHPRNTFDLDLIIPRSDRIPWTDLTRGLGYGPHREGPTFLQFDPPNAQALPLDLMLVNDVTFAKLAADAVPAPPSASGARMVSLLHLLALKCHAIKHGHPGRVVKDADDVIRLTQVNQLDVNDPRIRELFLRHGTVEKSDESAASVEPEELEFPDWSGMDDSSARVCPDAAFLLCKQYPVWFAEAAARWRKQRPEKCLVEFTL